MKILIAEDDLDILTSYKLLLTSRNHELFTSTDGDQCLNIFDEQYQKTTKNCSPFDLIILDYRMPKKDGIQVANHILSLVPSQRIIIASAYTHEIIENSIRENKGNIQMLQKPFEFSALLRIVEGSVEQSHGKTGRKPPEQQSIEPARPHVDSGPDNERFGGFGYFSEKYFL